MADELGIPGYDGATEIGRGGFGIVYRAEQPALNRRVAVKVLMAGLADDRTRSRFERERRAMGGLSAHPAIVTVHESGFTPGGNPYLVMEFMDGGSLGDRVRAGGPLPWGDVLGIGVRVASALDTAHRAGVLHRDVKPDNVLVSAYGDVKLSDFGIASTHEGTATGTGSVTASVAHAAPEVLEGQGASVASDVYSLGSTLHALLTGGPPFHRPTDDGVVAMITRILMEPVPDLRPRGVPAALCEVLEATMAKDPAARPASAGAVANALARVARGLGVPVDRMPGVDPPTGEVAPGVAGGAVPSGPPPAPAPPRPGGPAAEATAAVVAPRPAGAVAVPGPATTTGPSTPSGSTGEVLAGEPPPTAEATRRRRRRLAVLVGAGVVVVAVVAGALVAAGGGSGDDDTIEAGAATSTAAPGATAQLAGPGTTAAPTSSSTTTTGAPATTSTTAGALTELTGSPATTAAGASAPAPPPPAAPTTRSGSPSATTRAGTGPATTVAASPSPSPSPPAPPAPSPAPAPPAPSPVPPPPAPPSPPTSAAVPDVVGRDLTAASDTLRAAGFTNLPYVYDCFGSTNRGRVISQSPGAGAVAAFTAPVSLRLEANNCRIVPSVVGQQLDAAAAALQGQGFTNIPYVYECLGSTAVGAVVSQSPAAGADVTTDTAVSLRLQANNC